MLFNDPMPDCVPEFYRSRQEAADHEYERQARAQEHYAENREKIRAAVASGLPVLQYGGYGPCRECAQADHDTMTDAEDDMCGVICLNPSCPLHSVHQSKEVLQ